VGHDGRSGSSKNRRRRVGRKHRSRAFQRTDALAIAADLDSRFLRLKGKSRLGHPNDTRTASTAARAGNGFVVDVESAGARSLSQTGLRAVAPDRAQPGADAAAGLPGDAEPGSRRRALFTRL